MFVSNPIDTSVQDLFLSPIVWESAHCRKLLGRMGIELRSEPP